jgi:hypothetical protein
MTELLSTLLLQLLLALVALLGGAEPHESSLAPIDEPGSASALALEQPAPLLPEDRRRCSRDDTSHACHGARMRWQVTLPGPIGRCAGDCSAG